jgi:hypothetical protein
VFVRLVAGSSGVTEYSVCVNLKKSAKEVSPFTVHLNNVTPVEDEEECSGAVDVSLSFRMSFSPKRCLTFTAFGYVQEIQEAGLSGAALLRPWQLPGSSGLTRPS